ncbi:MAG TPA: hypothetical protein VKA84_03145 [Gemmatimonadaceae bacterium]|nr:hypothetical protein [Gemmatimonadaceae bacterium]
MPFTLRVQFTGLCLHVAHEDAGRPEVAVLMPDGRKNPGEMLLHEDTTTAVPHVGYLRVNLANVKLADGATIHPGPRPGPNGTDDGPPFELVYRFSRQTMDLGLSPQRDPNPGSIGLPDVQRLAPNVLRLRGDLFTSNVTSRLLFRTVLHGGSFTSGDQGSDTWSIDGRLISPDAPPITGQFSGDVTWSRQVDDTEEHAAEELTIKICDFDGKNEVLLPLCAIGPENARVIELKLANLCSDNPLEWAGYDVPPIPTEDSDFKWLYQLLEPKDGTWSQLLNGLVLPVPRRLSQPDDGLGSGPRGCFGITTTAAFPPLADWTATSVVDTAATVSVGSNNGGGGEQP